ncbi:diguanylate cyclase [Kordiimonas sediminis]|uniref:diguanylate cyclase n=1 Tax=Kordiimonas sediminis TaxID=1735581 RepID=A0A919E254_9PROT|nr:GGDEF domain-containing protein [Kordiimonas sediminis]GHF11947.1 diguanylate cyclase [Kordiimonas sediminis]
MIARHFLSRNPVEVPIKQSAAMAVRVGLDYGIMEVSQTGQSLVNLVAARDPVVMGLLDRVQETSCLSEARMDGADYAQNLWLVCVPEQESFLLVARDTTLPDKVTEALITSRALMKDLLDCAADLAFELDDKGIITFVMPADFLGRSTDAWVGKDATSVFWDGQATPKKNPFGVRTDSDFSEVPYENANGVREYLTISIKAVLDDSGFCIGTRGTARIITERVRREQAVKQEKLRLAMQERLTRILVTAESSDEVLGRAVAEVQDLFRADAVFIYKLYDGGYIPVASEKDPELECDFHIVSEKLPTEFPDDIVFLDVQGRDHMIVPLVKGDVCEGVVLVSRDTAVSPWSGQEKALLVAIGDILAAAQKKAALFDKLSRLSGQDELTQLLNRRAFEAEVNKRLLHQNRTGQSGCLMFIDLDHFKEVNDTMGHQIGDLALRLVASNIRDLIRPIDIAGRYGGDEFVIWIENIDRNDAEERARHLIDAMSGIRMQLNKDDLKLSMSVGICKSRSGIGESFTALCDRADRALYMVKRAGRGAIAFAEDEDTCGDTLNNVE